MKIVVAILVALAVAFSFAGLFPLGVVCMLAVLFIIK